MAKYTGILGTRNSQPGKFWPGAGPASSDNIQSITDTITAHESNMIQGVVDKSLKDTVTVATTLSINEELSSRINPAATVTDTIDFVIAGRVLVSQYATELFYNTDPD